MTDKIAAIATQKVKLLEAFNFVEIRIPSPPNFLELLFSALGHLKAVHYNVHIKLLNLTE